jgi:H+/gluconate symporter-like permease
VVIACALLTYGGISLFVVAFVIVPVAAALFQRADTPHRLIPATVALGAFTFTMTAMPGTPAIQNAIPMSWFGTTPFAAPGLGMIAAAIMLLFGLWSVATALLAGILALIAVNLRRLTALRATLDAVANASVLPVLNTASMVSFGAAIAALPAFEFISAAFFSREGGPLVSLAVATNVIAGITGSASGGLMITLQALGDTYAELAATASIDPELMHRVASIASGGLSSLPHIADECYRRSHFGPYGIDGHACLRLDLSEAMKHVRELRDGFVQGVVSRGTDQLPEDVFIRDYARLLEPRPMAA